MNENAARPWWADVLHGYFKALVGVAGTLAFLLGGAAGDGITLGEFLFALAGALGVGGGVALAGNSGPLAPGGLVRKLTGRGK